MSGRRLLSRACTSVVLAMLALTLVPVPGIGPAPASAAGAVFRFDGGGFGHGVGMSQFGAKGHAEAGRTNRQILSSYYPGTAISVVESLGPIVLLPNSNCAGTVMAGSTTIAPSGGAVQLFLQTSGGALSPITGIASGGSVTVSAISGGGYAVSGGDAPGNHGSAGQSLIVRLNGVPTRLGMNNTRYMRGDLAIANNGTTLQGYSINLTMADYLYGLAEMPSSWHIEALRAQAIAGRTYAKRVADPRRNAGSSFHIYGSTQDQCYRGYEKEGEATYGVRWLQAVNDTSNGVNGGEVVTYNGALTQTFYSSSNGGHSERSGYVFAQDLPYLVAAPDPYDNATGNSLHRWTRTFDGDDLGNRISGVGRVTSLSVSGAIGTSGRLNKATIAVTGTAGNRNITGSQLRSFLGLPDTLIFGISRDGATLYGTGPNVKPVGGFDSATMLGPHAYVQGWAADTGGRVEVHAYANGTFAGYSFGTEPRPDVGKDHPQYGNNRGYAFRAAVPIGTSNLCMYAIDNQDANVNTLLGCKTVTRTTGPPFGALDAVIRIPGGVQAQGWSIDPDLGAAGPVEVHMYADGGFAGYGSAYRPRPDLGYPGLGTDHGYLLNADLPAGNHSVCTWAINVPSGSNPRLGCRNINVSFDPFGSLDVVGRPTATSLRLYGWAIDPDTIDGTEIHIYVDGVFAGYSRATIPRADIGFWHPNYGSSHGYDFTIQTTPGTHQVCAYAINLAKGSNNPSLGCKTV